MRTRVPFMPTASRLQGLPPRRNRWMGTMRALCIFPLVVLATLSLRPTAVFAAAYCPLTSAAGVNNSGTISGVGGGSMGVDTGGPGGSQTAGTQPGGASTGTGSGYDPRKDPGMGGSAPPGAGQAGGGFGGGVPGSGGDSGNKPGGLGGGIVAGQGPYQAPAGGDTTGPAPTTPPGIVVSPPILPPGAPPPPPGPPGPGQRTGPGSRPPGTGQGTGTSRPPGTGPGSVPGTPPAPPGTPPVIAQTPPASPPASTGQCDPPLCREMCQKNCESISSSLGGSCASACSTMSPCGSSNFTLAQVKAACYGNILTRCNQGKSGRTGGWCVGVGADGTCEKRALSICGCDPITHPQCGGKWQSSVLDRSFLARVRHPFATPPSWTCGMPMGAWTLTSASNVVHLLISPVDLAAVLLRSVGNREKDKEGFAFVKDGR
jgi:hypothetical protein